MMVLVTRNTSLTWLSMTSNSTNGSRRPHQYLLWAFYILCVFSMVNFEIVVRTGFALQRIVRMPKWLIISFPGLTSLTLQA